MPFRLRLAPPLWLIVLLGVASSFLARCEGGVAAVVNHDVITFSEVRDLAGMKERAARATLRGEELAAKLNEIRLAAINEIVDRLLILQEFKSTHQDGAGIPPQVLDERIEAIVREQFGGDRAAFMRNLPTRWVSMERLRQKEEEKIIVETMRAEHQPVSEWLATLRKKAFIKIFELPANGAEVLD